MFGLKEEGFKKITKRDQKIAKNDTMRWLYPLHARVNLYRYLSAGRQGSGKP